MGILEEMIKQFKGCTIQSIISNSARSNYKEQVDAISDSEEQVDAISDSNKQVDSISNSEELVEAVSNTKSGQRSDTNVATYTTNRILCGEIMEEPVRPKNHPRTNPLD